jgi:hypothetical protein
MADVLLSADKVENRPARASASCQSHTLLRQSGGGAIKLVFGTSVEGQQPLSELP